MERSHNLAPGGGSLMIAWQLKDKHVLLVGGGEVASSRVESLLGADARITILCPQKGVHPSTQRFIENHPDRITYYDRRFTGPPELHKVDLVLTAIDDTNRSREIVELCRAAKIPVNAADIPDLCDFYFGAQIRDGPLQIMISTNGNGPRMSALIKKKVQDSLSGHEGSAIQKIGQLRAQLKERAPGVGGPLGRKRMRWMSSICNEWQMEDFMQLDDVMIGRVLDKGWEKECIPTPEEVGGKRFESSVPHSKTTETSHLGSLVLPSISFIAGAAFMAAVLLSRRQSI